MKLSVIGTGYVGLTTAVGLASKGHCVIGVEKRPGQIALIRAGKCPFYEQGLEGLLSDALARGKFTLTPSIEDAVLKTDISFICVGTPPKDDGSIDLSAIREVADAIGLALAKKPGRHIVVVKSTVLPGTTDGVVRSIIEAKSGKKAGADFGLAMVPEFLREGSAVRDFLEPDRIVIGSWDEETAKALRALFSSGFSAPIVEANTRTAEMIKYANNSFLALCISFSNEIAGICERVGQTDAYEVMSAVAMDGRITTYGKDGSKVVPGIASYLVPGCGFGGSCFPKDLMALSSFSKSLGMPGGLVEKAIERNRLQAEGVVARAEKIVGGFSGKTIAVLGVAFKPETDDIRGSPALAVIGGLAAKGAKVKAYDPQALAHIGGMFKKGVELSPSCASALEGADLAIVVTAWKEFAALSPNDYSSKMRAARVLDCRGIYGKAEFSGKLEYYRTGYRAD